MVQVASRRMSPGRPSEGHKDRKYWVKGREDQPLPGTPLGVKGHP